MKTCFKCSRALPLSDFYRHPQMGNGHLGKCKDCTKRDVRENREQNVERYREYDRQRSKLPHVRERIRRTSDEWAARFPERKKAQTTLGNAVRDGRIVRPWFCQRCGTLPRRIEGHHWDYSKPLQVEWLCKPCHARADQERRAA